MNTKPKINKKQVISTYHDRILNEWQALTYDQIRKKIYEDSQIEVNNYDIQSYISKNGLKNEKRNANKKEIAKISQGMTVLSCRYNQTKV